MDRVQTQNAGSNATQLSSPVRVPTEVASQLCSWRFEATWMSFSLQHREVRNVGQENLCRPVKMFPWTCACLWTDWELGNVGLEDL